jgi:hypothetical protein
VKTEKSLALVDETRALWDELINSDQGKRMADKGVSIIEEWKRYGSTDEGTHPPVCNHPTDLFSSGFALCVFVGDRQAFGGYCDQSVC